MKKLLLLAIIAIGLLSCGFNTTPKDIQPYLYGELKDFKQIYYPSSDYKACAVVVAKNGDVYYLRVNGYGTLMDNQKLFNINEIK